jgi:pantothenate kinase
LDKTANKANPNDNSASPLSKDFKLMQTINEEPFKQTAMRVSVSGTPSNKSVKRDSKEYTKRVVLPNTKKSFSSFPYLVVNIGSGVSILKVTGPGKAERVSGTSLGGGTYWGLCRLLTSCETYEEVLNYAENGNANVVDMLVKDIYGGDCKMRGLTSEFVLFDDFKWCMCVGGCLIVFNSGLLMLFI